MLLDQVSMSGRRLDVDFDQGGVHTPCLLLHVFDIYLVWKSHWGQLRHSVGACRSDNKSPVHPVSGWNLYGWVR